MQGLRFQPALLNQNLRFHKTPGPGHVYGLPNALTLTTDLAMGQDTRAVHQVAGLPVFCSIGGLPGAL